jgi:hypothetical protein
MHVLDDTSTASRYRHLRRSPAEAGGRSDAGWEFRDELTRHHQKPRRVRQPEFRGLYRLSRISQTGIGVMSPYLPKDFAPSQDLWIVRPRNNGARTTIIDTLRKVLLQVVRNRVGTDETGHMEGRVRFKGGPGRTASSQR